MKKNIVLAMTTAAVIAALTGCGSSKTTETTAATTTAAETTTADATTAAESKEADKTDAAAAAEGSLKALENVDPNGHLGKVLAAGKITMGIQGCQQWNNRVCRCRCGACKIHR